MLAFLAASRRAQGSELEVLLEPETVLVQVGDGLQRGAEALLAPPGVVAAIAIIPRPDDDGSPEFLDQGRVPPQAVGDLGEGFQVGFAQLRRPS